MPRNAEDLEAKLRSKAMDLGVDLLGVADITRLHEYLCAKGGEFLRDYPRAVAIGARLIGGVADQLFQHHNLLSQWSYRSSTHLLGDTILDPATIFLAKAIEDAGYHTYAIHRESLQDGASSWAYPLKLTGYLAGLGWIGKNSLLVNPKLGPRLRLSVVLTDAPLAVGSPMPVRCGTCHDCIDICPPKVLSPGVSFDPKHPREDWSHGKACKEYRKQRIIELSFPDTQGSCGLCLYACPFGKKRKGEKANVQRST